MPATFDKEGALERVDGDVALLKDLVQICREQCRTRLPAMERLLLINDLHSIATNAHALKGSLGNVGAEAVSEVAARLEQAAKRGDEAVVSELIASFGVEVDEFFEVVDEEL